MAGAELVDVTVFPIRLDVIMAVVYDMVVLVLLAAAICAARFSAVTNIHCNVQIQEAIRIL